MGSERRQVEEVFQAVLDAAVERRPVVLRERCGDDSKLRHEVERLVRAHEAAEGAFLEEPALVASLVSAGTTEGELREVTPALAVPHRVGPYDIIRVLGEGGMGVVYEARQQNPNRTVALKVIRPGQGTAGMIKRFQREADVLGHLHHPGIAYIYEAGSGRVEGAGWSITQPYIAMELIRGEALTKYCESRALVMRERLELVARVADAVQHAHEHGVIHRDLKPSNILVDGAGQPKILDFGVARLTESELQTVTVQTDAGQIIGTLDYMSPEQVTGEGKSLDGRSDIYSLGVILFESLTGRLPHDLRGRPVAEAVRILREEEPSRLSSHASGKGGAGGSSAGTGTRFDRDVETIVTKALEKDRSRRYATAAEFAADIRRHLQDEPIVARPASTFYQLRKFAKRNRALVGGVVATFVALVAGLITVAAIARRESVQREIATRERARAERQTYRTSLAAALASIENHDGQSALSYLEEAPEELRGWEWTLVRRMADPSVDSLTVPWAGEWTLESDGKEMIAWSADRVAGTLSFGAIRDGRRLGTWGARVDERLDVRILPDPRRDQRRVALIWLDGGIEVREIATGEVVWRRGDVTVAWGMGLDPNGKWIAIAVDQHRHVVVLDAATGETKWMLETYCHLPVPSFSPDGKLLAAGDHVFELEGGRALWRCEGQFQSFSADSRRAAIIVGSKGPMRAVIVEAWSGAAQGEFASWHPFVWTFPGVVFGDDGEVIFDLCSPGQVTARDATTLEPISSALVRTNPGTVRPVGKLEFEPGTRRLLVTLGTREGTRVFDTGSVGAIFRSATWHPGWSAAHLSPGGTYVFRGDWGSVLRMETATGRVAWRTAIGLSLHRFVRASPEVRRVAADGGQGKVHLLDADDGRLLSTFGAAEAGASVASLRWESEWSLLVGYDTGSVVRWDVSSAEARAGVRYVGLGGSADALDVGDELVVAGTQAPGNVDGAGAKAGLCAWKRSTGEVVYSTAMGTAVYAAALDSGSSTLLLGVKDGVQEWSTRSWKPTGMLRGAATPVRSVGWDVSKKRVWAGSEDARLLLWAVGEGERQELASMDLSATPISDVGFTSDESRLAVATAHETLSVDVRPATAALAAERSRWARAASAARWALAEASSEEEAEAKYRGSLEGRAAGDVEAGLAMIRGVGVHAPTLNSKAWEVVIAPTHAAGDYAMALRRAEGAAKVLSENWAVLNTLGLAQYRAGKYEEAIGTLGRSEELVEKETGRGRAANWAIVAMAQRALGRGEEAGASMARARELVAGEPGAATDSTRALMREAGEADSR